MPGLLHFREGGLLDRLDKAISSPVFHCVLPKPVEMVLTMPGAWFGCPAYAWGFSPVLLACIVGREKPVAKYLGLPALVVGAGWWLKQLFVGNEPEALTQKRGVIQIFKTVHNPLVLFGLSHATMSLITYGGLSEHAWVVALYLSSWYVVQGVAEAFKSLVWRLRPTAVLKDLQGVRRGFPELGFLVRQPDQANLSFPSGDSAGSACFATALALAAPELTTPAIILACTSGFGRMYFHAHHFGDVVAGELLGAGSVLLMHRFVPRAHWGHCLLAQLAMVFSWPQLQKMKPKLPDNSPKSGFSEK